MSLRTCTQALAIVGCLLLLAACGDTASKRAATERDPSDARNDAVLAGTIVLRDRTWNCHGPVNLDLVRVELSDSGKDAVHLGPGCTGTIRRLEIPGNGAGRGPGGDGVKVHAGAHNIVVLGGYIDCGKKVHRKHQDAIQAMGGTRVVFYRIASSGCANSFMFINRGRGAREIPSGIRCFACTATSHNYSIFAGTSVESGAVGGTFSSRVPPKATQSAVAPAVAGNRWTPRAGGAVGR